MTIPSIGESTATHGCPDDHEKDTIARPELLDNPLSQQTSSDVDNDHEATVNNGDGAEQLLLQQLMPALEQDMYAKITKTTSQANYHPAGSMTVSPNIDRESCADNKEAAIATHPPEVSRPGAYEHIPQSGIAHDESDSIDDLGASGTEARESNQEGLVVANLVEDQSLEFALPDSEEPSRRRENKTRQNKAFVLLSVILLLAATGVVLLAVLSPSKDEIADSNDTASLPPKTLTTLEGYVLSLLPEETANAILDDSSSPQSRAFHWLLDDDLLFDMPDEQVKQRFALATLYFATNGDEWTNNTNWLNHSVSECDWYSKDELYLQKHATMFPGIVDRFFRATEGVTVCDERGLYQHLMLDQNNLHGSLPEELYMLTHLRTLAMAFNRIQGPLSTRLGLLTGLEAWLMNFMPTIGGTIQTEIGLLTNLRCMSVEGNNHLGTIPTEIWQLTRLEYLFFSLNPQLKDTIPTDIGRLSHLRWLGIDSTGLSGTIPTEIAPLQYLEMLTFFRDKFSGTVPSELGLLTRLFYLGLGFNDFTGTIPTELGLLTSVSQLSLRGNHLESTIPSQLGLLTNLEWTLNFRSNQLTGTIPSELGLLTGLYELEFRDNMLTGKIPSELGQATSLGYLSFANNSLSGSVPEEIYSLSASLHTLSLEDNSLLSGILPSTICEINATCVDNLFNPCESPYGFSFSCSSLLCGCGCNLCIP